MKHRKTIAALLLAALLIGLLSGCHGSRGQAAFTMPESFDADRTYELTFWAKNDTNKTQIAVYEQAIAEFQALYPNITVSLRRYTDYGKIYNDVITNIATQTTPNICITYPDHIATYLTGVNTVAPLNELFADPRYGFGGSELRFDAPTRDEMIGGYLDECAFDGTYYAVPFMRSTEACYINRDYVEALGYTLPETLTWDFIWEVSEAAMAQNPDGTFRLNGQKVMIPFIYKSTDNMMIQMLRQTGGGYAATDGSIGIFNDTTRDVLKTVAEHAQSGAFSTFKISSYPANFLNAGQCVFAIDSTAGSTWMGTDAPLSDISEDKLVDFETVVLAVPQYDTAQPQMISQGPSICIFNKSDPQEVLASWLFVQYLLTNDVQIGYAQTEGYAPVTACARSDAAYQDYLSRCGEDSDSHYAVKIRATELLLEHVDDMFTTPVFNGSSSLRDAAGQLIENTVKSVRRGETVDDAYLDTLFESINALYRLDQKSAGVGGTGQGTELGPLPGTAAALLATLAGAWLLIGAWALAGAIRKKRSRVNRP